MKNSPQSFSLSRLFLFVSLGLLPLGQFARIELRPGIALYMHEITLLLFVMTLITLLFHSVRNIRSSLTGMVLLAVEVWIISSILLHFPFLSPLFVTAFLYLLRLNLYVFAAIGVRYLIDKKVLNKDFVRTLMLGGIGVIAALGWVQYFFLPDTRSLVFMGWDDHYLRLISTLFDPGFTGMVLCIGSLLLGREIFSHWKVDTTYHRIAKFFSFVLITSALLFTYSRASYVAFFVGILVLVCVLRTFKPLVVAALFVVGIFLLPRPASEGARLERTASITARLQTVQQGIAKRSLVEMLIGKGWYSTKSLEVREAFGNQLATHASAPENSFVFIYTSLGIVGLSLFGWLFFLLVKGAGYRSEFSVVLTATLSHAVFTNTLFYPFVLFLLGVVWALRYKESSTIN
jgi:hypothetical protein